LIPSLPEILKGKIQNTYARSGRAPDSCTILAGIADQASNQRCWSLQQQGSIGRSVTDDMVCSLHLTAYCEYVRERCFRMTSPCSTTGSSSVSFVSAIARGPGISVIYTPSSAMQQEIAMGV
jgi:hypothetical protein